MNKCIETRHFYYGHLPSDTKTKLHIALYSDQDVSTWPSLKPYSNEFKIIINLSFIKINFINSICVVGGPLANPNWMCYPICVRQNSRKRQAWRRFSKR